MIQFSCRPGSTERPNEDWCGGASDSAGELLVVLDGVTTPGETGCRHGTPWYVNQLGLSLLHLSSNASKSLTGALGEAIENVTNLHVDTCDIAHRGTPAAAVAVARSSAAHLDYLVLADTTVAINRTNGVHTVSDSRVAAVTEEDAAEALKHPIGSPEQIAAVRRMSTNQQAYRNHPDGYWVAASDPKAADQAVTGRIDDALAVALLSDGASRSVDLFEQNTWTGLMELLRQDGPDAVLNQVRAAERQDPSGQTWPRFKTSDDAACAYADTPEGQHPTQGRDGAKDSP